MFRIFLIFVIGIFILDVRTTAHAETGVAVRTLGSQNCDSMINHLKDDKTKGEAIFYIQWLAGYITAYNTQKKIVDGFPIRGPIEEFLRFVVHVCAANLDKKIFAVLKASLDASAPYHIKKSSEVKSISVDGKKYQFYKDYLKASQSFLKKKGYRVTVDGLYGSRTETAFRKYKTDNKLGGMPVPDYMFLLSMIENQK